MQRGEGAGRLSYRLNAAINIGGQRQNHTVWWSNVGTDWAYDVKVKVTPGRKCADTQGKQSYNSNPLANLGARRGMGDEHQVPVALPRAKIPVSIVQEAAWASGLVWRGTEYLVPSPAFDPRTVQPVASR